MDSRRLFRILYPWRVRSALFVLIALLVLARPSWASVAAGLPLTAIGLLIRAWASGHIRKEKALAVSGPYRHTRNPLYLSNFLLGLSVAIGSRSWWGAGLFLAYFLVFYPPVILEERERMIRLFPGAYDDFRKAVPLFFPRLTPRPGTEPSGWSRALYLKNKEYRALIGAAVIWAVLVARVLLAA